MIAQKVYDASDEEQVRQARIEEEDTEKERVGKKNTMNQ